MCGLRPRLGGPPHGVSVALAVGTVLSIAAAAAAGRGAAAEKVPAPAAAPAGGTAPLGVRLLVGGYGLPYIAAFAADGTEEWRIAADGHQCDCWLLDGGHVLYTGGSYVREVARDANAPGGARTVWQHQAAKGWQLHGCQPLGKDRVVACEAGGRQVAIALLERPGGREVRRVETDAPGGAVRQVRATGRGTYLFGVRNANSGFECDANGHVMRKFPGVSYTLGELPGGGYLGSGSDNHSVVEYDPNGSVVWRVDRSDVPGMTIGFAAAVCRLADGSTLLANWGGHGGAAGPCLVRISRDRRIIGALALKPANRIACFQLLPSKAGP